MKLVDILARELKEWPEGILLAVQDEDSEIKFDNSHELPHLHSSGDVWILQGDEGDGLYGLSKASDFATAIVTRAEWQAAVDALNDISPSLYIQQAGRIFRALSSDPGDIARAHISNLIYGAMSKLGAAPTVAQVNAAASALTAAGYQQFEIIDEPQS